MWKCGDTEMGQFVVTGGISLAKISRLEALPRWLVVGALDRVTWIALHSQGWVRSTTCQLTSTSIDDNGVIKHVSGVLYSE